MILSPLLMKVSATGGRKSILQSELMEHNKIGPGGRPGLIGTIRPAWWWWTRHSAPDVGEIAAVHRRWAGPVPDPAMGRAPARAGPPGRSGPDLGVGVGEAARDRPDRPVAAAVRAARPHPVRRPRPPDRGGRHPGRGRRPARKPVGPG